MQGAAGHKRVPISFLNDLITPVPPIDVQHRIVDRVGALSSHAREFSSLCQDISDNMQRAVASLYDGLAAGSPQQTLQQVASPVRRPITTTPDGSYPELGLRSFGKGTFHKPALSGTEVGNKRIFRIHAGDLGFSNSSKLVKRQREITKLANSITEDLRRFEAALLAKAFRGEL